MKSDVLVESAKNCSPVSDAMNGEQVGVNRERR
jgi:hypothetical protein